MYDNNLGELQFVGIVHILYTLSFIIDDIGIFLSFKENSNLIYDTFCCNKNKEIYEQVSVISETSENDV